MRIFYNFILAGIAAIFVIFCLLPGTVNAAETDQLPKANKFIQSLKTVTVSPGEQIELILGFQNIGNSAWHRYSLVPKQKTSVADQSISSFANSTWVDPGVVISHQGTVEPGAIIRDSIQLKAPDTVGSYVAELVLEVDDHLLEESVVELPITVTENAPNYTGPVQIIGNNDETVQQSSAPPEPRIRVGFWKPESFVQFRSDEADYDIYDGEEKIATLPIHHLAVLKYEDGQYILTASGVSNELNTDPTVSVELKSTNYFRLAPVGDPHAVFTLPNLNRHIRSEGKNNFNSYRGAMEYRLTQDGKTMYVINDVLFEDYVAGIAETSNGAPIEYIKALLTAARTYAYYVQHSTDKHDKRNFDVVGNTGDQLYLGYVREQIAPRVVEAAKATRGYFITYKDDVVITPYFGHSNGKTRSWTQKWGGKEKPWLVSVKAGYDKGLKLFGHGVGMSQRDAAVRASKEKLNWQEILKYYYTGIELKQLYE